MGSKNKEKKNKHDDPQTQIEADEFEDNNIVVKKNKKIKTKKETIDVKIQSIGKQPDKISPFLGYFPTNYDPLKNSPEKQPEVSVYWNVIRKNDRTKEISRYEMVVRPNGSDVNFVGNSYKGEAAAPQICTYALGVLDKETKTLKIVPVTANKIFRLEPKVPGSDAAQEDVKAEVDTEHKAIKRRDLDLMYSTKKTIAKNKKKEALYQKQDARSKEDLNKTLEEVKVNAEAIEAAGTTNSRNIPFHDISASTPEKAYPLEKIIGIGEWDYLGDLLKISKGTEVTPDAYPIFVCNRLHKLKDIKDEYEKSTMACVLQYITHLIKYNDKHSRDRFKSVKNHKFPSIIEEKFRSMFSDSSSEILPDAKRNFLISHVLVLTLFVDGYRSDLSDIAKDLKMTPFKLRDYFFQLGCKIVREKSTQLYTLPVPLKFPAVKRQRQR